MQHPLIAYSERRSTVEIDHSSTAEVPFPIFSWDDLVVTLDGEEVDAWVGIEPISGILPSGTIRFEEPLTGTLTIKSDIDPARNHDLIEGAGLSAKVLNNEFDRLAALAQEAERRAKDNLASIDRLTAKFEAFVKAAAAKKPCVPIKGLGPDVAMAWDDICDGITFGFDRVIEWTRKATFGADKALRVYDLNSLPTDDFYRGPRELYLSDPAIACLLDDCALIYSAAQLPPDQIARIK